MLLSGVVNERGTNAADGTSIAHNRCEPVALGTRHRKQANCKVKAAALKNRTLLTRASPWMPELQCVMPWMHA
jgi:hypothetical protein